MYMLITNTKFKDYYDGAVGMGIDKTIVYERATKDVYYSEVKDLNLIKTLHHETLFTYRIPNKLNLPNFYTSSKSKYDDVSLFIIGFCGKYYLGFKFIRKILDKWGYDSHKTKTFITYNVDEAKKELSFDNEYSWKKSKKNQQKNLIAFNAFVDKIKNLDDSKVFSNYHTPIFLIKETDIVFEINPELKEFDFYKVVDTYTAFQEVQMYISGVLGTNEDGHDTPMSEKEKVQQHGFDQKYGFRTRPKD